VFVRLSVCSVGHIFSDSPKGNTDADSVRIGRAVQGLISSLPVVSYLRIASAIFYVKFPEIFVVNFRGFSVNFAGHFSDTDGVNGWCVENNF